MRATISSLNVTETIVQDLGVAIVTGKYDNVTFPKESELCEKYSAARSVTREAVKMLVSKGLMSSRRRRGIVINSEADWNLFDPDVLKWILERNFSLDLLIEFTEIRLNVEPGAASLAAKRATPKQKEEITKAINRMIKAEQGEDDNLESDIAFHIAVLEASGNRFFIQLKELIDTALRFSIRKTNEMKGARFASVEDHKTVADAILIGKPDLAEKSMQNLIKGALALMEDCRKKELSLAK